MSRSLLCTATLVLSFSVVVQAGTSLVHAPEVTEGQKILTESTTKTNQTLTINGMALETASDTFATTEELVNSVSKNEVITSAKIDKFQIELSLPGGQSLQFDNGNPNAEAPAGPLGEMTKFFKALSEANWKTTYDADRKVESVEYLDNAFNEIPEVFKQDTSPERVKTEANQMLSRLPGKEVEQGDSWTLNEKQNLGSGQVFNVTRKFTYLGTEDHNGKPLEHISFKTETVEFEIGSESQLPIQSKSSDLKVDSSEGHLWYDPAQKRVVESEEKFKVTGNLVLVANGAELPTQLDLSMHLKSVIKAE